MKRGVTCAVHVHDSPVPLEDHHIHPLGYHGPDTAANKARVCSNAHGDTHYYLEYLLKHNGQRPPNWRTWSPRARALAVIGYARVIDYATKLAESMEV